MKPLDRLPTIRSKLGSTIVVAVAVTLILVFFFVGYALRNSPRDSEVLELLSVARQEAQGRLKEIPPGTQIVVRSIVATEASRGTDLGVSPPNFDDQQAHWGIKEGVSYVAIPKITEGAYTGTIYAMAEAPGQGLGARLSATAGFLKTFLWQFLAAGAVAALIALALARWLARGMTTPLRDMAKATKGMAQGDYSQRVETTSRDEVGQLADAFNKMSGELAGTEQLRRELVANVSHELKTPISALRAHLENLLDGVEDPDPETLEVMLKQSERLSRLVEQLLELSRLESGDIPLHPEPTSLGPLIGQVVSEIDVAQADKGVVLANRVNGNVPEVLADRERIHQVLFNLLDNAVRYTPPGGEVAVTAERDRDRCTVTVSDTGPGIGAEHLPKLFERFYRVDAARTRGVSGADSGGTGIGLAIAKSVVEAHGGHIWADSVPGRGAEFHFDLPVAPVVTGEATRGAPSKSTSKLRAKTSTKASRRRD